MQERLLHPLLGGASWISQRSCSQAVTGGIAFATPWAHDSFASGLLAEAASRSGVAPLEAIPQAKHANNHQAAAVFRCCHLLPRLPQISVLGVRPSPLPTRRLRKESHQPLPRSGWVSAAAVVAAAGRRSLAGMKLSSALTTENRNFRRSALPVYGTERAVSVMRPSSFASNPLLKCQWRLANRDAGDEILAFALSASPRDKRCSDAPETTSLSGRACRNSAQAGDAWKFLRLSAESQTVFPACEYREQCNAEPSRTHE